MRNFYFTLLGCCMAIVLQAQVSRQLQVSSGNLENLLTPSELLTITDLTLTGTINAWDIRTMRNQMPALSVLDMERTSITPSRGELYEVEYPANMIPSSDTNYPSEYDYSFSEMKSLTSIILPATLTAIGSQAFLGCTGLIDVEFPSTLTTIDQGAFMGCTALPSVSLPSSLTIMGWEVFHNCSSLVRVEISPGLSIIGRSAFGECTALKSIIIPSSVNEIHEYAFYNCNSLENVEFPSSLITIGSSSFARCRSLASVTIPSSVSTIEGGAFSECSALTKVIIPRTLQRLENRAFAECPNITSIYMFHSIPLEFSPYNTGVFDQVEKASCTLYVPASTKELYATAPLWKDFQHIVEMPPFTLSVTQLTMQPDQGTSSFEIATNDTWTASTDQPWLTINPLQGNQAGTVSLTAENNPSYTTRTAIVKVSIADSIFQDIRVMQKGVPVEINVKQAGTLFAQIQGIALRNISELVISGELDVRDIKLIRDSMLLLETMDLRKATIKGYYGKEGTFMFLEEYDYPENEFPPLALVDVYKDIKRKLTTVFLPESATSLAREALSYSKTLKEVILPPSLIKLDFRAIGYAPALTNIEIPPSTTILGHQAFAGCTSLLAIELPQAVTEIGIQAFESCNSLTSVKLPPLITSIRKKTFYSCLALTSVEFNAAVTLIEEEAFFNCIKIDSVVLPPSLKTIGIAAFAFCEGMSSLSIPASIEKIGNNAFSYCKSLKSIYTYAEEPPVINASSQVFRGVDQENCILYVPAGSKSRYATASVWEKFKNIVEMEELKLSASTVFLEATEGSSAEIAILSDTQCHVSCNQSWLIITSTKGTAQQTVTFTAQANKTDKERSALVTISASGYTSRTIEIKQHSMTVGTDNEMSAIVQIKYYPNPFTTEMTIEIANLSHREVSVEIFSMTGQKIRSLSRALKEAKVSLSWDGRDDKGQQVPNGIYLLKLNEETKKVMVKREF